MGDDPCACFFDHEAAMRRMLNLLRDTQTECTDGNCDPSTLPGGPAGGMVMWTMLWGLIALGMYFMRPNSMRNRQVEPPGKPGPSSDGNGPHPPPPGIH